MRTSTFFNKTVALIIVLFGGSPLPGVASCGEESATLDTMSRDVIVFTHGSNHHTTDTEIYMINPDGSNLTRLTTNNWVDWMPRISPDGRTIAFSAGDANNTSAQNGLYAMDVLDRSVKMVTDQFVCHRLFS